MDFTERLKALRIEKNIPVVALAERLGKAESTVRMWEIGKAKPDIETLMKLSQIFECATDYLLGISEFKRHDEYIQLESLFDKFCKNIGAVGNEDKKLLITLLDRFLNSYKSISDRSIGELYLYYFFKIMLKYSLIADTFLFCANYNTIESYSFAFIEMEKICDSAKFVIGETLDLFKVELDNTIPSEMLEKVKKQIHTLDELTSFEREMTRLSEKISAFEEEQSQFIKDGD